VLIYHPLDGSLKKYRVGTLAKNPSAQIDVHIMHCGYCCERLAKLAKLARPRRTEKKATPRKSLLRRH